MLSEEYSCDLIQIITRYEYVHICNIALVYYSFAILD